MITREELSGLLQKHQVNARIEECEDDKVLLVMPKISYNALLAHHDFDGPALRDFLEQIVGMGRVYLAMSGGDYQMGFSGDIAEVHALEQRLEREERIAYLRAEIPRMQAELAKLEGEG